MKTFAWTLTLILTLVFAAGGGTTDGGMSKPPTELSMLAAMDLLPAGGSMAATEDCADSGDTGASAHGAACQVHCGPQTATIAGQYLLPAPPQVLPERTPRRPLVARAPQPDPHPPRPLS